MASTPDGRRLTEAHRLAQQQVRDGFLAEFIALWALLDSTRLDDTGPGWVRAVMTLIESFRLRSAQVSTGYYHAFRNVEAPRTPLTSAPPPEPRGARDRAALSRSEALRGAPASRDGRLRPDPRVIASPRSSRLRFELDESAFADAGRRGAQIQFEVPEIDWSRADRAAEVSLIVTGPVGQKAKAARGKSLDRARDESFVEASGAGARHVLTGGRQSLLTLLQDDAQALGWARVTDGDPCAWCAMLSSRGPVFRSRESAAFPAHDACGCTAEPVYDRRAPWPGRGAEFRRLWRDQIEGQYSGDEAIRAWRRLYEQQRRAARRAA